MEAPINKNLERIKQYESSLNGISKAKRRKLLLAISILKVKENVKLTAEESSIYSGLIKSFK